MQAGERFGQYEIITLIGQGGMGEVYKARDIRLNRDVAIKSSREQFSERFEREASTIAALNHPNICTLYDVGPDYLVMEFVEGQTLDDRIKEGSIPLEESLRLAHQITNALESAHERNITHRDLKPGNVMIRPDGTVKVLDFGLAKVGLSATSDPVAATVSRSVTYAGTILGTPAYMAPEQAKGRPDVDKRADIWAFGVVFYELLTGQRLFPGDDMTEVLAAVVLQEPSLDKVPVQYRRLLKKCLEKDPKKRLRDIGDVWDYEDTQGSAQSEVARHKRRWLWPLVTASVVALAAIALGALWVSRPADPTRPLVHRFNISMPEKVTFGSTLRISPDGRYLVFRGFGESGGRLYLRAMDSLESRPLAGTDGVVNSPFWAPDSGTIVFGTQNRLMKVSVSGGPPIKICDIPSGVNVGFWAPDNHIVFGTVASGVFEVPVGGGTLKPLTELASGEVQHAPQALLPDGKHFLYLVRGGSDNAGVNIRALDDKPSAPGRRLLPDDTSALFAATHNGGKPGWIVFAREGTLLAQPFDPRTLNFAGDPVPIGSSSGNLGGFSVSETGDLVYGNVGLGNRQLDWYSRKGVKLETAWKGRAFNEIELSPDGTRVAAVDSSTTANIWVYDFQRKSETQITTASQAVHPVWSPNGQRLVWGTFRSGLSQFFTRAASTADPEQLFADLAVMKTTALPSSWSRDGRFLLFDAQGKTGRDLMRLPIEAGKAGKPEVYLNGEGSESSAQFSPSGSLVAYVMSTGSRSEIYVSTFPDPNVEKWPISAGGGYQPRWSRDGGELFYVTPDGKMMSVEVKPGPSFGVPKGLFQAPLWGGGAISNQIRWDIHPDGKFLINSVTGDTSAPLTVVLNWEAGL